MTPEDMVEDHVMEAIASELPSRQSYCLISFADLRTRKGIPYGHDNLRLMWKAGKFPEPIVLGHNRLAWLESEVDDWIAAKLAARACAQKNLAEAKSAPPPRTTPSQPRARL